MPRAAKLLQLLWELKLILHFTNCYYLLSKVPPESHKLAPIQQIMLRDSLADGGAGAHVEQLEIVFKTPIPAPQVAAAWTMTVAQIEVLRMAFVLGDSTPGDWEQAAVLASIACPEHAPEDFEKWLQTDRSTPLLHSATTPWRAIYWEPEHRLVWTFHHALIDGRSITAIIRQFLQFLFENLIPPRFALTHWSPADEAMRSQAQDYFEKNFSNLMPGAPPPLPARFSKSSLTLDSTFVKLLENDAAELDVSPATLVLWTWGQAVARVAGMDYAVVEQVRCGPPQPGRLGFSMNTLPLLIPHCKNEKNTRAAIRSLRRHLLGLRTIEAISPLEHPSIVSALTSEAWSSVIMIETFTLEKLAATQADVHTITLHENPGESLTATALLTAELRLEVEGPASAELLEMWQQHLTQLCSVRDWPA